MRQEIYYIFLNTADDLLIFCAGEASEREHAGEEKRDKAQGHFAGQSVFQGREVLSVYAVSIHPPRGFVKRERKKDRSAAKFTAKRSEGEEHRERQCASR